MNELLLELADDELILGWRDSEWTGIAPLLEEDVALSSIAQNEIGHARAAYELLAPDADALAFDRAPAEYRSAPLVQLRLLEWAPTIARRILYELADEVRLELLKEDADETVRGLAAKMDREEVYHRLHARLWSERLLASPDGRGRLTAAVHQLWPYALGVLPPEHRGRYGERVRRSLGLDLPEPDPVERGEHDGEWPTLWDEMTMVRRSAPAGAAW